MTITFLDEGATVQVQPSSRAPFAVTADGAGVVGHAGVALLCELADRLELTKALAWHAGRHPARRHRHQAGRVLRDLAVMLADGGDCLSDLAVLRDQPELFGAVASTATAWRVIERDGTDPDGLAGLRAARAHARAHAWAAGAWPASELLLVDLDATLVDAHSDKEGATGTFKGGFGFHPLLAFLDRADGTAEPLAAILREGNAAANTAADLVELADLALAQQAMATPTAGARSWPSGRSSPLPATRSSPCRRSPFRHCAVTAANSAGCAWPWGSRPRWGCAGWSPASRPGRWS